ncbi:MAG: MqnA/MqnD/SBP family protein [Thermoplasmata archaeon]
MEIVFPDVPEYHFILRGLCSDRFPSYPKFHCEALTEFEGHLQAEIAFVPAPVAILNSDNYILLRAGNIFSYFSGPQIFSSQEDADELFVSEHDFVSQYYAKILLGEVNIKKGKGSPVIMEPRIAMMSVRDATEKFDLYNKWAKVADDLPFPLYSGIIKKSARNLKEMVENAIGVSVKYALNNASDIIKDIAIVHGIENFGMLKRVIFHFVNKNTLSITEEEMESLRALGREMENKGFHVSYPKF